MTRVIRACRDFRWLAFTGTIFIVGASLTWIWWIDIRDALLGAVLHDDTTFASRYTENAFRRIHQGMTEEDVLRQVGSPLSIVWSYGTGGCQTLYVTGTEVRSYFSEDACNKFGLYEGMSSEAAVKLLGAPISILWRYSQSMSGSHFRVRDVWFANNRVEEVGIGWYLD